MKANCAKTPPKDSAGGPVDVEVYLQYAQENIKTSRMLLEKGNLRYAVFLANEGLELLVKAHMLRYRIIDKAITAKHFPYPAAVREMVKITKSNIGKKPPNKKQLEQSLDPLHTLEEVFDIMKKKELEVPLWKLSLNIELADDERKWVDKLVKKIMDWNEKMARIQGGQRHTHLLSHDILTPEDQDRFFGAVLGASRGEAGRRKNPPPLPMPGNREMPYAEALVVGRTLALVELIIHIGVISRSFPHQQIARYPTLIDGVDSRELYMARKDDVKNLLGQIYALSDVLMKQLKCGAPFLMQDMVAVTTNIKEFMRP